MTDTERWFDAKLKEFKEDAEFYAEQLILDLTEQIVATMKEQNINRTELASRLGVSKAFITKLLNGNMNMTLKTMASIAKALGCKIDIGFHTEGAEVTKVYRQPGELLDEEDLRPEYQRSDFLHGLVREKYTGRRKKPSIIVALRPEVAKVYPDEESVNNALLSLIDVERKTAGPAKRKAGKRKG